METTIKGYKVFNSNWTARHDNFQYEVGKEYEMGGEIIPCKRGFHFCEKLEDCFNYYNFAQDLKVAEVEGTGQIKREGNKIYCSRIRIVKEILMDEVLKLINNGKNNLGVGNKGNYNQGSCNQGDYNQGDYNQGYNNKGSCNQGDYNQGSYNQGDYNQGDYNHGNYNHGSCNIGIGNRGNGIVGLFCEQQHPFYLFDKPCSMSVEEFRKTENCALLLRLEYTDIPQLDWEEFTDEQRQTVLTTENITPEILKKRYGIKLTTL